ncbi:hypothetical protein BGZ49_001240 [Haplosporangium sp. Z 27]|nr:hypothetical protein BGZ49_001240 [Haplosporangium sp. Z 27]
MNTIETNETDVHDMHSFFPCGADDLTEDDIASANLTEEIANLPFDENDELLEESIEESAPLKALMKEEDKKVAECFNLLSNDLIRRFEGPAPWIKCPLATARAVVEQSGNRRTYDYEPRVFFLEEANYVNWIEEDGRYHFFTWRKVENRETECDGTSRFEWWGKLIGCAWPFFLESKESQDLIASINDYAVKDKGEKQYHIILL